jgi:hypothetical protein
MSNRTSGWLRRAVGIGSLAVVGLLYPVAAMAQETPAQPSGAAVEVGGVSVTAPAIAGGLPGGAAVPAGAQSRTIVLPSTGGGPVSDPTTESTTALAVLAGAIVVGTVAFLRRRRGSQARIGG